MDQIIDQLAPNKHDKVVFANANDGMHVFINSVHKGYFVKDKLGLAWRPA